MAYTTAQLSKEKVRPIHGRNGALDVQNQIVGPRGMRLPVADLGTAATTLAHGGVNRVTATGSTQGPVQHNLPAPMIGEEIEIHMISTSTGSHQFLSTPNGAAIISASGGATASLVNMIGPGGSVKLRALSTAMWGIVSRTSTAMTMTTAT